MSAQQGAASAQVIDDRAAPVAASAGTRVRLGSIDMLRGLVMVLMVLDHTRDFFGVRINPVDLSQTTEALFMTRWITHLCAPTFIFLAGVGAYMTSRRMTRGELSRFLFTRGLWLIVLEFTVVNFSWGFDIEYRFGLLLTVMWSIGVSMVVLAGLVYLPMRAIAAVSLIVIAGHNLLDGIAPDRFGALAPLWTVLHVPSPVGAVFVAYPLIPWVAVIGLGYAMGPLFELEPQRRAALLRRLGIASLALFVLLRLFNLYGDPIPWTAQDTLVRSVMSFINLQKYPPSLMYLLMTLGTAFLLLPAFESAQGRVAEILRTFGRVPLFFFILHIPLLHFGAGLVGWAMGFGGEVMTNSFAGLPAAWGFGLPVVYVAWAAALLILYPACRWFGELKRRRSDWWLSYL